VGYSLSLLRSYLPPLSKADLRPQLSSTERACIYPANAKELVRHSVFDLLLTGILQ
jgi:hypothetical protein